MNGERAYKLEELERKNPHFLIRLEAIVDGLILSEDKEGLLKSLIKKGYGQYLENLQLIASEKHIKTLKN